MRFSGERGQARDTRDRRGAPLLSRVSRACPRSPEKRKKITPVLQANIDDMISLEQSASVKIVMLWPGGKTDVRVPKKKEKIAPVKNIELKN